MDTTNARTEAASDLIDGEAHVARRARSDASPLDIGELLLATDAAARTPRERRVSAA